MRQSVETPLERPRQGPRGPEPPHAFHVKFTYPDPNVAARVTQRLGTLFVDHNTRDRGALANATNQFLETQLAEARTRLEAQERRLEAFREQHGSELPTQMQSNMQAIQSTQMQIQALVESIARDRDRKLMLERLLSDAENEPIVTPPSPLPQVQTSAGDAPPANMSSRQQLQAARESLARLELRLRPEHPDVIRTKRLISELEPKAAVEDAEPVSDLLPPATTREEAMRRERLSQMRAEIESLDRQTRFKESEEQRLRAVAAEYQRRIEAVPGVESEWSVLTRDYDTHQAAYKDLLSKSEAARVAMDLERRQIGENFRILDPAGVPVTPVVSPRRQINGIGFAVGLFFGVGLAAFLELRDSTFRSESDILDVLSLPVLALIPYVENASERRRRRRRQLLISFAASIAVCGAAYVTWTMKLWKSVL
jgi:polysaccharide chain length determinant protein (PEP-CTERM system associated)